MNGNFARPDVIVDYLERIKKNFWSLSETRVSKPGALFQTRVFGIQKS